MQSHMRKTSRGFTLVELVVVIAVIAILATITVVAHRNVTMQARDTVRRHDITAIAEAIALYRQKCGNDVGAISTTNPSACPSFTCGSGGGGNGWFNNDYGSGNGSARPDLACLQAAGYLSPGSKGFVDPTGCVTTTGASANGSPLGKCSSISGKYYSYMKYTGGTVPNQVTCVFGRLETPSDDDIAYANSVKASCGGSTAVDSYNMNFAVLAN